MSHPRGRNVPDCLPDPSLCLVTGRIFFYLSPPTSNLNNITLILFYFHFLKLNWGCTIVSNKLIESNDKICIRLFVFGHKKRSCEQFFHEVDVVLFHGNQSFHDGLLCWTIITEECFFNFRFFSTLLTGQKTIHIANSRLIGKETR